MDTIAHSAAHPYYLRSLNQPGAYPGLPLAPGSLPPPPAATAHAPYDIPTPNLPRPPPPKGIGSRDYYDALEARDQAIRKGMVKQTSLEAAMATVGTCPDMCPEKERYMRADQRRLSLFELDTGCLETPRVDHARAIKEYSGSAADKEEPLPHELRPLGVLRMTMDYLLTCVMDSGAGREEAWYDFVWNRTRAIRKDITLQHLSSPECVGLIEKCARFHILCGHFLCEQELMAFDPRMNNENLIKCLQSLKEFYRDLRTEGSFPNEADFCCYDILLHLSDGNVLNLVERYSPTVRASDAVRFAVNTVHAFDSNNFVKFFKLVRSASYLCACILHRYFGQMRIRGLKVLNRAHSIQKRPLDFPLSDVVRMLAFENEQEAAEFCESCNLNVKVTRQGQSVQLVRSGGFNPPETAPEPKRSSLIKTKNDESFGVVVNGGPLPPPLAFHAPYDSFGQQPPRAPSPSSFSSPTTETVYSDEELMTAIAITAESVVQQEATGVARECLQEAETTHLCEQVCLSLLHSLLEEEIRTVAMATAQLTLLEAVKKRDEQRELERLRDTAAESAAVDILTDVILSETVVVVTETHRECRLEAAAHDAAIFSVVCELVELGVCEEVRGVCGEAVAQAKHDRRDALEAIERQFLTIQLHKYWKRWQNVVQVRQHIRQCVSDFPPIPSLASLPRQLDTLVPSEKRRRLDLLWPPEGQRERLAVLVREKLQQRQEERAAYRSPIALSPLLQDMLLHSRTPHTSVHASPSPPHPSHSDLCWLALLARPHEADMSQRDRTLLRQIETKLGLEGVTRPRPPSVQSWHVATLSRSSVDLCPRSSGGAERLHIAVKRVCVATEVDGEESLRRQLQGSAAVLCYVPHPLPGQSPEEFGSAARKRLSLLSSLLPPSPRLPLLLLVPSSLPQDCLAHWLQFRMGLEACPPPFAGAGLHHVLLTPDAFPAQVEEELCTGLLWLAEHSSSQPPLLFTPLRDFVEQGVLEAFVPLVTADGSRRRKSGLPSQPLRTLVHLYGTVLDHLCCLATRPELREMPWPVLDFAPSHFSHTGLPPAHWNSHGYLSSLCDAMKALSLPDSDSCHFDDWSAQCTFCLSFVAMAPAGGGEVSLQLMSRVKALLRHHSKSLSDSPRELSVPWDQVVLMCVDHVISHMTPSDQWVGCLHGSKVAFEPPSLWVWAEAETSIAMAAKITEHEETDQGFSPSQRPMLQSSHRQHKIRRRSDPYLPSPPSPSGGEGVRVRGMTVALSPVVMAVRDRREKLDAALRRERDMTCSFEAQLQQWLHSPDTQPPPLTTTSTSPRTDTSDRTDDQTDKPSSERSLEEDLQLLEMKIKTTRLQNTMDTVQYELETLHISFN